ncbi:HK97-gp10 family putative phage morphogenesis protein [Sphingomonas faeni]|uniref:HK97-gp10 family putative phage morphogenesis protein n=1 Tax=Sphingomonas faeni TaxID=185950 RepID=UPI0020BE972F|nr:HK97-gp10 family putative phage morphogenesis protein [Sphingomonas faeni]MCK8457027.1 HK97 gp10 family phage protein [Sphingomonas faeni]
MMGRKFSDKLRTLAAAIKRDVAKEMYAAADIVATEAHISITTGSVGGKNHVASQPGEAPNSDTQVLNRGIHVLQLAPLHVQVVSTAPYSVDLEYGTSKMAARPFMRPAADKSSDKVDKMLRNAAFRAARRHFKD